MTRAALEPPGFSPGVSQRELQEHEYRFSKVELLFFLTYTADVVSWLSWNT
jgi:hypothetical protein